METEQPAGDAIGRQKGGPGHGDHRDQGDHTERLRTNMPLEQAVNRAKADVDQRQAAALNGGIDVDETVVDVTIDARTQVAEVQSRGGEQKLVTRRGQAVILTPESCVSTIAAIDAHRSAAAERAYDLYVAVDAAADLDALRAIDIAVGWPSTVEEDLA